MPILSRARREAWRECFPAGRHLLMVRRARFPQELSWPRRALSTVKISRSHPCLNPLALNACSKFVQFVAGVLEAVAATLSRDERITVDVCLTWFGSHQFVICLLGPVHCNFRPGREAFESTRTRKLQQLAKGSEVDVSRVIAIC